jgi:cyanophycinase
MSFSWHSAFPARTLRFFIFFLSFLFCVLPLHAKWRYFRTGNAADLASKPTPGFALMGGGKQDAAFRYLCERANGGDFLILRANTEDDYAKKVNEEVKAMCPLNSVATIVFSDRDDDSSDPKIPELIAQAEAIFFAGGDQSNYVRFWQDTPIQDAVNRHIAAGKPLGGSSAGLAILGEFSFASIIDTIHPPEALGDPYGNKVTLSREFLRIPLLAGTITDTHFGKRDRMGRLLVFMARILQDGWAPRVRAIAVEEDAAVLLEPDGSAKVIGGPAWFLEALQRPEVCRHKTPLKFTGVSVKRVASGGTFQLKSWNGPSTDNYTLSAADGHVTAAPARPSFY